MSIFGGKPDAERERYEHLRSIVKLGIAQFRKVGMALKEIRDHELYRFDCQTFEECCNIHWGITPQHAGRLIDAAEFCQQVEPTGCVPTSERQVRQLRALPNDQRADAWSEAAAAGATPAAIAKAVEKRRRGRPRKPKPIRLRVPGAWVTIEPNAKFTGVVESLQWAIEAHAKKQAA